MTWGTVYPGPEVEKWLEDLPTADFARAVFYIEMLAEQGPRLGEPCIRQLNEETRELRFYLDKQAIRRSVMPSANSANVGVGARPSWRRHRG